MIEEAADWIVRPLARLLGYVVIEVLWHVVCHVLGWTFLRCITLGRHPETGMFDWRDRGGSETAGALLLIAVLVGALALALGSATA